MALDASEDMIREVWPGDTVGRQAFRGDWLSMPFEDGSFDLVLSDCGLTPLVGAGLLETLGDEMRRVLRPEGRVVMRHFASGDWVAALPVLRVLAQKGQVVGFHEFKLRLLMAVDAELDEEGVPLGYIWERFQQEFPDRRELARQLGVDATEVDTIDAYRGKMVRYAFPPVDQLARRFTGFEVRLGPAGRYGFAEACPVFSMIPVS
jgi:SAM-dependent methyltransferase